MSGRASESCLGVLLLVAAARAARWQSLMLLIWLQDGGGRGNGPPVCVCVLLSLPLYLGWASDALAAASGTHFKLAHATDDHDDAFRK